MTITGSPWTSSSPAAVGHSLHQVELPVLAALADGDLDLARTHAAARRGRELEGATGPSGLESAHLTPYLVAAECRVVWARRLRQLEGMPTDAVWITRILLDHGAAVGRAGFHGPPDRAGMVEVGYSIDPAHRRQGHARAALVIMLDVARADPRVSVVRATIRPDNIASRGLVDQYGFEVTGEQWDEEDGREIVLERSVR